MPPTPAFWGTVEKVLEHAALISLDRLDAHLAAFQAGAHQQEGALINTETPQLAVLRVVDAPRAMVFRAFTDPDHLAMWWGPRRTSGRQPQTTTHMAIRKDQIPLPRGEIEFDLLEGVMYGPGHSKEGLEPFETRFRIEFHDEPDGRTRLEIRQWLPAHLAGPSSQGWREAFEKLDATLRDVQAVAADVEV